MSRPRVVSMVLREVEGRLGVHRGLKLGKVGEVFAETDGCMLRRMLADHAHGHPST